MEQTAASVWDACLGRIRARIKPQSYQTWFEPLKAYHLEATEGLKKLTVQIPSQFYFEWIEQQYYEVIKEAIEDVLGPEGRLFYKIVEDVPEPGFAPPPPPSRPASADVKRAPTPPAPAPLPVSNPFALPGILTPPVKHNLHPSYVFERYIEGDCNRLARSAAQAIANNLGATSFNPFLVYGGVGLGKTHLIHSIGNHILRNDKSKSVLYVSSEQFTSEFVQAIKSNKAAEFSQFYRSLHLLIIDDIQFFEGKEKTQEEFFHIFNALHQSGRQIILSSDRPPKEIRGIEDRLLSRFSWGLSTDVKPPELETRIAILQRKAEDEGTEIDYEVIDFIAHNIKSNIRELEGALIRLHASAALNGCDIDLPFARQVLADMIEEAPLQLGIEDIVRAVSQHFHLDSALLSAKTRKREVVQARQVAMYLCKQLTPLSLKAIGDFFGGRDHSTVIHAAQSVENLLDTDAPFKDDLQQIRRRIENGKRQGA